jgi:hypothetical protein
MFIGTNGRKMLCICHSEEMVWEKDGRKTRKGYWRCRIKKKEKDNKYSNSPKGYVKRRKRDLNNLKAKLKKELELVKRISKS